MFQINRVFHLTHVVDDLDRTLDWYQDVLGAERLGDPIAGPTGGRICLVLVGDLVMLPMVPAPEDQGAVRFRQRFGQHLHSLAWYVEDAGDLVATLENQGFDLKDELGRPLDGINHEIWTPPRQAPCLLEFFRAPSETEPSPAGLHDPRFLADWSPEPWRRHPLGIERTAFLTVVTHDLHKAAGFFTGTLRGVTIGGPTETVWGTESIFVQVGDYTVIEVARPRDDSSRAARDLADNGEILHAATFQVADMDRAESFLSAHGLGVDRLDRHALALDTDDTFGLLLRFTDEVRF